MKKFIKCIFVLLAVFSAVSFGTITYYNYVLGDNYFVTSGNEFNLNDSIIKCRISTNDGSYAVQKNNVNPVGSYDYQVSLFGVIPIKTVNVTVTEKQEVAVLGTLFGIRIFTEGVLVVGFNDVDTHNGNVNPAKNSGIKNGDVILEINGKYVSSNNDVQKIIINSKGQALEMLVKRDGKTFTVNVKPVKSVLENKYKCGLWIRDSSAGIGTMTFYSPSLDVIAGLGHGICDADTEELVPLESGQFVEAEIVGIKKSDKETTGELQGIFSGGQLADMICNDNTGVYGTNCCIDNIEYCDNIMPIAHKQEVKQGKAQIITTLGDGVRGVYDCTIEKVYLNDNGKIKNMVIKITDQELLEKTGGIVQGMSGSPIIQNGKLVGAVTHVLVDDPTKGYAIFAENMLETAQSVAEEKLKEAS